ncbi:M20/M25/M40 family metallo-hydrolase [Sulfuriroseicoccus oceanibius]|uniref:M20/M25/M40 family metallo-hydrolase n=1 Tax=Sulfuriroseicoccus oceanibius TaxID=2707525 RepID=A0A7T7JDT8_9BACT|nr:M20/M25/M40 family metallo-hydrolase [Sulfuriroseicoccus oceanibius]
MNLERLAAVATTPGAPGYEKPIRDLILGSVTDWCDSVRVDNIGNVICHVKGKNSDEPSMAAAHMDEIGFIVKSIDERGFIRFAPLGGFDPKALTAQRVIVHAKGGDLMGTMGGKPIHIMKPDERGKALDITDFFIDLGLPGEQVNELVEIGDPITRWSPLVEVGDCVNCKSLDNRASVFVLLETLREIAEEKIELSNDFYAVFTVQEEVGLRGVLASSLEIQPKFGIGLDTTIAFDGPGSSPDTKVTSLGDGTAIKIMDSSVICDPRMIRYMKAQADAAKIKWQPEVLTAGGTDTAGMQRNTPGGAIVGAISIPTRNIHLSTEMSHKEDLRASIDLLKLVVANFDQGDWAI